MKKRVSRLRKAASAANDVPAGIALNDDAVLKLWKDIIPYMVDAPFSDVAGPGERYQYQNGYYSYGDALVMHGLIYDLQPERLIEIGSGYSTAAVLDTRNKCGFPKKITCVEPYPERLKSLLLPEDASTVKILDIKVQDTDMKALQGAVAGRHPVH